MDQSLKKPKKVNVGLDCVFDIQEATKSQKLDNGDKIIHLKEGAMLDATYTRNYHVGVSFFKCLRQDRIVGTSLTHSPYDISRFHVGILSLQL